MGYGWEPLNQAIEHVVGYDCKEFRSCAIDARCRVCVFCCEHTINHRTRFDYIRKFAR
jgi:hypothetical protein